MKKLLLLPLLGLAIYAQPGQAFNPNCLGFGIEDYISCYQADQYIHWCYDDSFYVDTPGAPGDSPHNGASAAAGEWESAFYPSIVNLTYDGYCAEGDSYFITEEWNGVNEVLAYADYPGFSPTTVGQTAALVDDETGEILEFDILVDPGHFEDVVGSSFTSYYKKVFLHEWGHALGLGHETDPNYDGDPCEDPFPESEYFDPAIMCTDFINDIANAPFDPQPDDLDGLWFIYGDTDRDGCTGLEESSDTQSLGGGLSWGTLYRSDNSMDLDAWVLGRKRDQADINGDRTVSSIDQGLLGTKINQKVVGNGGSAPNKYDFDGDGWVKSIDQGIMGAQFGDHCYGGPNASG